MTNKEAIEVLELMRAEVEWEYTIDYSVAIDKAIEALNILDSHSPSNCRFSLEYEKDCFNCGYLNEPATNDKCSKCRFWGERI